RRVERTRGLLRVRARGRARGVLATRGARRAAGGAPEEPQVTRMRKHTLWTLLAAVLLASSAQAQLLRETPRGEVVERHLPGDRTFMEWVHDPDVLRTRAS